MALKSTIYKVSLQVSDFERDLYQSFTHKVALHPSETLERMLLRLLAFSVYADEDLTFTKGLSTEDEPDLWRKSLSGEVELWIDLGLPDLKRVRKAAGRSRKVLVFAYGGQKVRSWFDGISSDLEKIDNITVIGVDMAEIEPLIPQIQRSMELALMIQKNSISVTLGECYCDVKLEYLFESA